MNELTPVNGSWVYPGVSSTIIYIATRNLATAEMLKVPVQVGNNNLSYTVSFDGPTIGCLEANTSTTSLVLSAADDYLNSTGNFLYWAAWNSDRIVDPQINGSFFVDIERELIAGSATPITLGT